MSRLIENNKVRIVGEIVGQFEYSHEVFGENFYIGQLKIERTSGILDFIPIMVSDRMVDISADWNGIFVEVEGSFRSYNKKDEEKRKLLLSVFVRDFNQLENASYNDNDVELDGYICKETIYRKTPLGRDVSDLLIAVNRPYGKSDYIPCIAWGRNAVYSAELEVGTRIKLYGRIQSREYAKRISDTETETRTAYEVSVSKLEVVTDNE